MGANQQGRELMRRAVVDSWSYRDRSSVVLEESVGTGPVEVPSRRLIGEIEINGKRIKVVQDPVAARGFAFYVVERDNVLGTDRDVRLEDEPTFNQVLRRALQLEAAIAKETP